MNTLFDKIQSNMKGDEQKLRAGTELMHKAAVAALNYSNVYFTGMSVPEDDPAHDQLSRMCGQALAQLTVICLELEKMKVVVLHELSQENQS